MIDNVNVLKFSVIFLQKHIRVFRTSKSTLTHFNPLLRLITQSGTHDTAFERSAGGSGQNWNDFQTNRIGDAEAKRIQQSVVQPNSGFR